jgi:hypothetical protein
MVVVLSLLTANTPALAIEVNSSSQGRLILASELGPENEFSIDTTYLDSVCTLNVSSSNEYFDEEKELYEVSVEGTCGSYTLSQWFSDLDPSVSNVVYPRIPDNAIVTPGTIRFSYPSCANSSFMFNAVTNLSGEPGDPMQPSGQVSSTTNIESVDSLNATFSLATFQDTETYVYPSFESPECVVRGQSITASSQIISFYSNLAQYSVDPIFPASKNCEITNESGSGFVEPGDPINFQFNCDGIYFYKYVASSSLEAGTSNTLIVEVPNYATNSIIGHTNTVRTDTCYGNGQTISINRSSEDFLDGFVIAEISPTEVNENGDWSFSVPFGKYSIDSYDERCAITSSKAVRVTDQDVSVTLTSRIAAVSPTLLPNDSTDPGIDCSFHPDYYEGQPTFWVRENAPTIDVAVKCGDFGRRIQVDLDSGVSFGTQELFTQNVQLPALNLIKLHGKYEISDAIDEDNYTVRIGASPMELSDSWEGNSIAEIDYLNNLYTITVPTGPQYFSMTLGGASPSVGCLVTQYFSAQSSHGESSSFSMANAVNVEASDKFGPRLSFHLGSRAAGVATTGPSMEGKKAAFTATGFDQNKNELNFRYGDGAMIGLDRDIQFEYCLTPGTYYFKMKAVTASESGGYNHYNFSYLQNKTKSEATPFEVVGNGSPLDISYNYGDFPDSTSEGSIRGTVLDASGDPLGQVPVELIDAETGTWFAGAVTNNLGEYQFLGLNPVGTYTLMSYETEYSESTTRLYGYLGDADSETNSQKLTFAANNRTFMANIIVRERSDGIHPGLYRSYNKAYPSQPIVQLSSVAEEFPIPVTGVTEGCDPELVDCQEIHFTAALRSKPLESHLFTWDIKIDGAIPSSSELSQYDFSIQTDRGALCSINDLDSGTLTATCENPIDEETGESLDPSVVTRVTLLVQGTDERPSYEFSSSDWVYSASATFDLIAAKVLPRVEKSPEVKIRMTWSSPVSDTLPREFTLEGVGCRAADVTRTSAVQFVVNFFCEGEGEIENLYIARVSSVNGDLVSETYFTPDFTESSNRVDTVKPYYDFVNLAPSKIPGHGYQNSRSMAFAIYFDEPIVGIDADDFSAWTTVGGRTVSACETKSLLHEQTSGELSRFKLYRLELDNCLDDSRIQLRQIGTFSDLAGNERLPDYTNNSLAEVSIRTSFKSKVADGGPHATNINYFYYSLHELDPSSLDRTDFTAVGDAGCTLSFEESVGTEAPNVGLTNCGEGRGYLKILPGTVSDLWGNVGPATGIDLSATMFDFTNPDEVVFEGWAPNNGSISRKTNLNLKFQLQWGETATCWLNPIGELSRNSSVDCSNGFNVSGLTNRDQDLYVRVTDWAGNSTTTHKSWTINTAAATPRVNGSPTSTFNAQTKQLTVAWDPATVVAGGLGITGYRVIFTTDGLSWNAIPEVDSTVSSVQLDANFGQAYRFAVETLTSDGTSSVSGTSSSIYVPYSPTAATQIKSQSVAKSSQAVLVRIDGSGFVDGKTSVKFGTTSARVVSVSENEILVLAPASKAVVSSRIFVTVGDSRDANTLRTIDVGIHKYLKASVAPVLTLATSNSYDISKVSSVDLVTSSTSGGEVAITSTTPKTCSVLGARLTLLSTGTCNLTLSSPAIPASGWLAGTSKKTIQVLKAPALTSPVSLVGLAKAGVSLKAIQSKWSAYPTSIKPTYQWYGCASPQISSSNSIPAGCTAISKATASTYKPSPSEIGTHLVVSEKIMNTVGSVTSYSNSITVTGVPFGTGSPYIDGAATVGNQLFASNGYWLSVDVLVFQYQWQRCVRKKPCVNIPSATSNSYTPTISDRGSMIRVQVVASNSSGKTSVLTALTPAVISVPASAVIH